MEIHSSRKSVKCVVFTLCLVTINIFFLLKISPGTISSSIEINTNNKKIAGQLHAEGLKLYNQKKYKEAIETWLKELKLDPSNPNTMNNIGISYKDRGDYITALKYHKKAIELNPRFGHAYYSIGLAYLLNKDYKDAIDSFSKAIELNYRPGAHITILVWHTKTFMTLKKQSLHSLKQ